MGKLLKVVDCLDVFESKWIVVDVLKATLEVHPVQVRFGNVQGVSAHVLEVENWLLVWCGPIGLALQFLTLREDLLQEDKHVEDSILAGDGNHDLSSQIDKDVFQPIPELLLIHVIIDPVDLHSVLEGLDVAIRNHQVSTLEERKL